MTVCIAAYGGDAVTLPLCDTALLSRILRCLMRPPLKTSESSCKKSMTEIIYRHGISGDRPVILLDAMGPDGWSWYTGAAGWYFNAVLGYLLGYREHDGGFEIRPAFCAEFRRFTLTVSRHGTEYVISAEDTEKTPLLDGALTEICFFPFDRGKHTLDIGRKR